MSFIVKCKCGKRVRVEDDRARKEIFCPSCSKKIALPGKGSDLDDEDDGPPVPYGLRDERDEDLEPTLASVAKKRAERLKKAAKTKLSDASFLYKLQRKIGLRPWNGNQYQIKIAAGEKCVVSAQGLQNLLVKGEITPESEVAFYDRLKPMADADWLPIEAGPARREFCLRILFDPLGAYVQEGARRGAVYGSLALWSVLILIMVVAMTIQHGPMGGLAVLAGVAFTIAVLAFEAWLFLEAHPAVLVILFIFCGFSPLVHLISFLLTHLFFMAIGAGVGVLIGLLVGSMVKASAPQLPDPSERRARRRPRRLRDD